MAYPVYSIWFDWKCLSNVNLIILTTCSPSRSLRCYTHLKLQAADNHFLSLTFAPPLKRGNHGMDVLILDLCEGILCEWGELSAPWFAYSVKVRSAANSGWVLLKPRAPTHIRCVARIAKVLGASSRLNTISTSY